MSVGLILDSWEKVQALEALEAPSPPDSGPKCIFRGQGDSTWGLKPSLTRLMCELGLNNPDDEDQVVRAAMAEEESIRIFQNAHPMQADLREWIFWWAVAQHYGGATRVIDWSKHIGVAVYFAAARELGKDGAVFELERKRLLQNEEDPSDILHSVYNSGRRDEGWIKFQQIFRCGEPLAMHVCTANAPSVRIAVQAGYFTSCTNILQDHEWVIQEQHPGALRKHIIPKESKPELLREACIRGYSGTALFSDSSEAAGYAQRDEVIRWGRE